MNIRRIRSGDGPLLREVRLRALRIDPDAFGSSYEETASHGDDWWQTRVTGAASGKERFIAVAVAVARTGRFVGLIGAYTPEEALHVRHLVSTWVAPDERGNRLGSKLVCAVIEWAKAAGASEVTLWVVDGNCPATTLYEEAGFVPTGEKQPLPSNPSLIESLMALSLH